MVDSDLCFFHDPSTAAEAAEARRLGGLRRRRHAIVDEVYDFHGLSTIEDSVHALENVYRDVLGGEVAVARARTAIRAIEVAARLRELRAVEEVAEVETWLKSNTRTGRKAR